ncbi:MAG: 50S ribosomal protein L15 [Minisyncoccia bacterium]
MQLHNLQRNTPNKTAKRIGRGGARGKTSGRGTKGQKARAGHRIRPNVREELKKLPKLRGRGTHALRSLQPRAAVVNLAVLERYFSVGEQVTPEVLAERRAVRSGRRSIKILGGGELTKKLTVSGCAVSASAKNKIEAAGGSVA